jgi:(p)ppGpp synthase/HD superfamily hydrolase
MTLSLEQALRWASECHRDQVRRSSGTPYFEHVAAVAMILDRLGFGEEVLIAGLLHDVVEDTPASLEDVRVRFGDEVAETVRECSEVKTDDQGRKRPWLDRKRDHLAAMTSASLSARAVMLADKLHNLVSIVCDLEDGREVWAHFHAGRELVLWYYHTSIATLAVGDSRLEVLGTQCLDALKDVERRDGIAGT